MLLLSSWQQWFNQQSLHKGCSTYDESTPFLSPSYLQAYYERLECLAESKLYRIIPFSYAPRTITHIFCNQVHTPVGKLSSKSSAMASRGVPYIVFVQRHRYPWTPRFYWVSSSLYVDLWADRPFHFLASLAYGNFHLGEEMIVLTCEYYGSGYRVGTCSHMTPCWRDSRWEACVFPMIFSSIHYLHLQFPQCFTGKDWGSVNCHFLLVHGTFFWWRVGCSWTPKGTRDAAGVELQG